MKICQNQQMRLLYEVCDNYKKKKKKRLPCADYGRSRSALGGAGSAEED